MRICRYATEPYSWEMFYDGVPQVLPNHRRSFSKERETYKTLALPNSDHVEVSYMHYLAGAGFEPATFRLWV